MKTSKLTVLAISLCAVTTGIAQQQFNGVEATKLCKESKAVQINRQSRVPSFIWFREDSKVVPASIQDVLRPALHMQLADGMRTRLVQRDEIGMVHERMTQTYNDIPVESGEYIIHSRNGIVQSANGMWFDGIALNTNPAVSKSDAIDKAISFVNATTYRWESAADEAMLKRVKRNPDASYYPSGELVIVCRDGDIFAKDYVLAWKLDVFATEPMSRQWIFVDAQTGDIVHTKNRIHHIDVPATGNTMYSGTQSFTCDNMGNGTYRLRQTAHGNGVETYDLNNSTNTGNAVDFTNNSTTWTSTANDDHAALDAHWGAEGTYDFFLNEMGRNGLDGNGMLMVSYVHYGSNYNNAFWNGTEMTYGDGSGAAGGFNPLTAIDVCGHEFSHGVTEFSSNLDYQDESGALNESFSDIFGTAIEFYRKPAVANFLMGEEIVVSQPGALRSLQNPNLYGDPDCYMGTNYYTGTADNGGVHTNSGVQNFWYYLCSQGGSGTNDNNDAYNVTGFGWYDACRVAFRNNTYYLVNTSQYMDSRVSSIQAAQDLFGACSAEVIAVTNAWYACGVGPQFSATVAASFTGNILTSCSVPTTVTFTNTSSNATTALWNFGDMTTDTSYNPTHTYTAPGTYNVSVSVSSACGTDQTTQNAYITINPPAAPTANGTQLCNPGSVTLNATGSGQLSWYSQQIGGTALGNGTTYTTPTLSSTTTYYVENVTAQPPVSVGPNDNTFGTGGQHNNTSTQYLEFDVFQNCTLATAVVFAGSSGNKTFTLWDNQGNQLNQYTVNVPGTGQQTVTLNIPLTPGSYRIGGTQMNLYRNNAGASYPYTSAGALSITGSSAGSGFYYYLYNWTVNLDGCHSPRTPVTVVIGSPNIALNTAPYDTTCSFASAFALTGGSPAGGTYSGPGVSGGMFDPVAAGLGLHTITYTYTDSAGCTGSANSQILVDVCNGISSATSAAAMSMYPNPTEGDFTIEFANAADIREANLTIVNSLGQVVQTQQLNCTPGTNRWIIDANNLAAGIYFVNFTAGENNFSGKLEVR
jgi:Zn-dependent metalloprotease